MVKKVAHLRESWGYGIHSKHSLKILEFLIGANFDDKITQTRIGKELNINLPRISEALESLKRNGMVKSEKIKKKWTTKKRLALKPYILKLQIFALSLNGLVYVLANKPSNWARITEVIERQPELFPPIFEHWAIFGKFRAKSRAMSALRSTFEEGCKNITVDSMSAKQRAPIKKAPVSEIDLKRLRISRKERDQLAHLKKLPEGKSKESRHEAGMNESELKRFLVSGFIRRLFDSRSRYHLLRKSAEALSNSPELGMLIEKVRKYLELNKTPEARRNFEFQTNMDRAISEVEKMIT
jgi:hypothetical protein